MKKILLFIIGFTILMPSIGLADVLQLIDGRTIEGTIIEQNDLQVVIKDDQGRISRFYHDQIANAIKGELVTPLAVDFSQFDGISQEKSQLIIRLMEANGTRLSLEKNIQRTLEDAPANRRQNLDKLFDINEIISEFVPVYDKYFSTEELVAIIEFYESPAGQKMIQAAPDLIKEVTQANVRYFQEKLTAN